MEMFRTSFGLFKAEEGTHSHLPTAGKDADNWICRLEFCYECGQSEERDQLYYYVWWYDY